MFPAGNVVATDAPRAVLWMFSALWKTKHKGYNEVLNKLYGYFEGCSLFVVLLNWRFIT